MDALRFELSSAFLTSTAVAASSLHSHSRHSFSSMQLGRVSSFPAIGSVSKTVNEIFTADELHYVSVPNSDWRLALWRYLPSSKVLIWHIHAYSIRIGVLIYMFYNVYTLYTGTKEETSFDPIVWDCEQCCYIRSFPWGDFIIYKQSILIIFL